MASKVTLQYVGPELREFGGKVGDEKFVVKAAQVASESTITNESGDKAKVTEYKPRLIKVSEQAAATLVGVKMGKGPKATPVFVLAEESPDDDSRVEKAEGTDGRMNAEPPAHTTDSSSFVDVSGSSGSTVEDKATPHVYPRKGRGS